jgi:AraC-like DNA-binding protein
MAERVRACLVRGLLGSDLPAAEQVADELHTSVRSLHRGLEAERTTFRALSDRLRHERGAELLGDPRYSIAEVAYVLGFAELSSFYRAFKRWTGQTPGEFRKNALSDRA